MPPVRGRSRSRGRVSPRRGGDYSPRRDYSPRGKRTRSRYRDREDTYRNRDREERRVNDLKQRVYNQAAKNTQRQKDRLRSQTEAFKKYLERQRDKFNQAQGSKVVQAKKLLERVPRAPAGWKRDPKTGKLIQGGGRKPRPQVTRATAVPNPQTTVPEAADALPVKENKNIRTKPQTVKGQLDKLVATAELAQIPYTPKQKTYGRATGLTEYLEKQRDKPKITEGERPTAAPATPRTTRKAVPKWMQKAVTTKLANKGGLMKKGHNDLRKNGLFYK